MTPERAARLVARWVRRYTRGLDPAIAARRREEVDADVADQLAEARASGVDDRRAGRAVFSRALRGAGADLSWRRARAGGVVVDPSAEAARHARRRSYRSGMALAVIGALALVWVLGALGLVGSEGDQADLLYVGVLAIGLVGALGARFRAPGMARALQATALAQACAGALLVGAGWVPSHDSPLEVVGLTVGFVGLQLGAAHRFLQVRRHRSEA